MLQAIILIVIGFIFLIKGADFLVDGSSNIAKKFHIPEIIIGLTIVSIGTSMPELFVSTTSALEGHTDMAMGNIIGSNVCNLLLILGLSSMIRPVQFQKETRLIEIPMCLILTILFFGLCNTGTGISRLEAGLLIFLFLLFIGYTIYMGKKGQEFDEIKETKKERKELEKIPVLKNVIYVILGIILLKIGGDFTVDNAIVVAKHFGLSEKFISLTILAVGTSLPELVTSVTAAIKGNSDIAIGNIIGSNIFNMLLIIGVSSFITPIVYNISYNVDLSILVGSLIILSLFPIIPPKNEMSRSNGLIYFLSYVGYIILLFNL